MSESEQTQEPQPQAEPVNYGGRRPGAGRKPDPSAPETEEEVARLEAEESVKQKPSATKQHLWSDLHEYYARRDKDAVTRLAQAQEENAVRVAALQGEIATLHESLAASEQKGDALSVPHEEFEQVKADRDSLRRELTRANENLILAVRVKTDAVASRDAALSAQHTAEQGEARIRQYCGDQFKRVIPSLEAAAHSLAASPSARELWYGFNSLAEDFKRMHSEAIATPVPFTPVPLKIVREAPEAERRKALEALTEQHRIENLQQPRSSEPTSFETMRERAIPRTQDPEPTKPISGGADFADWVK